MEADIRNLIGRDVAVRMDPDDKEQCTVNLFYPHVFYTNYLRQEIRLEIGPLAEWVPSHPVTIASTSAEQFPTAFQQTDTVVPTQGFAASAPVCNCQTPADFQHACPDWQREDGRQDHP